MIVLGIDPGLTGAIAALDHNGQFLGVADIPTCAIAEAGPKTTIKREVDVVMLWNLLRQMVPAGETALCAMEHLSSLGSAVKGDQAKASLAATKASIMAVLRLQKHTVHRVTPREWKRFYGLSSDKDACLAVARELYPFPAFARKKDHNRAEAVLIARWALRTLT